MFSNVRPATARLAAAAASARSSGCARAHLISSPASAGVLYAGSIGNSSSDSARGSRANHSPHAAISTSRGPIAQPSPSWASSASRR